MPQSWKYSLLETPKDRVELLRHVNPLESGGAWWVYLTTLFMYNLSPLKVNHYLSTCILLPETDKSLLESAEGREWLSKIFHDQSPQNNVAGPNSQPPDHQLEMHLTELSRPASMMNSKLWCNLNPLKVNHYLSTFFCQKLTSALLESAEGREWLSKSFHDQSPQKNVAGPGRDWTHNLQITSWKCIWRSYPGRLVWWTNSKLWCCNDTEN